MTLCPIERDPWSKLIAPAMIFNRVVFPAPFDPTRAILSPLVSSKFMPSYMTLDPYDFFISLRVRTVAPLRGGFGKL